MEVLEYLGREIMHDIVQNLSCLILGHFVPKYTLENI